jgi:hypothetical protein
MVDNSADFDEGALLRDLRIWWDNQVGGSATDPFAAPPHAKGTIFDVLPAIDSLGVVSGLITLENHAGIKIPARIIRRGGYKDFEDMTSDLLPKVKALVEKNKQKSGKGSKEAA